MAKVKGFNPPVTELSYEENSGILHYFGEFFRTVFGEGSVSPTDPDIDFIGKSRRGARPTEQGEGTEAQKKYREAFKNCTFLWNSLPEECPLVGQVPPPTSKKSVWEAKIEHGVPCSYYDLFMKCCIQWALDHGAAMPNGDCFPCPDLCICEGIEIGYTTQQMETGEQQTLQAQGAVEGCPYIWRITSGGGTLGQDESEITALGALIDEGETPIDKIEIVDNWITANMSPETTYVENPITGIGHDAYKVEIDGVPFWFDTHEAAITSAVWLYADGNLISPALKSEIQAVQIVSEESPSGPDVIAKHELGLITIFQDYEINTGQLAHESAHGLAVSTWGSAAPEEGSAYQAAIDSAEPPVSEYGETSPGEDFAEAVRLYTTDPAECLAIAPLRYAAIEVILTESPHHGNTVVYFAPVANPDCELNPTIELSVKENVCDTLIIAVNAYDLAAVAYLTNFTACLSDEAACGPPCDCGCFAWGWGRYNCVGTFLSTQEPYADNPEYVGCTGPCWEETSCITADPCNPAPEYERIDKRSSAMITGGCCPAELL